jgi:uncharacterized protein (DUF2225 family)
MAQKPDDTQSTLKISFLSKDEITCPACGEKFHREELLSGSGRLIAGELTDELHRLYEKSKYGNIYPLAYQAVVCPACWFAAMENDFSQLPKEKIQIAENDTEHRKKETSLIFSDVNFYRNRDLMNGAASQFLVCRSYDYYPADFSPTIKQGVAALRAGWLLDNLNEKFPGQHYDWAAKLFKKKACFLYSTALQNEESGKEKLSALSNFGPDTDKNYGYEGMLYLIGILDYKYGQQEDQAKRMATLSDDKRKIAKIFGLGKSSKTKPGPLLERGRELYNDIGKLIGEFDG